MESSSVRPPSLSSIISSPTCLPACLCVQQSSIPALAVANHKGAASGGVCTRGGRQRGRRSVGLRAAARSSPSSARADWGRTALPPRALIARQRPRRAPSEADTRILRRAAAGPSRARSRSALRCECARCVCVLPILTFRWEISRRAAGRSKERRQESRGREGAGRSRRGKRGRCVVGRNAARRVSPVSPGGVARNRAPSSRARWGRSEAKPRERLARSEAALLEDEWDGRERGAERAEDEVRQRAGHVAPPRREIEERRRERRRHDPRGRARRRDEPEVARLPISRPADRRTRESAQQRTTTHRVSYGGGSASLSPRAAVVSQGTTTERRSFENGACCHFFFFFF